MRDASRGSPRSFAAQRTLAQDDKERATLQLQLSCNNFQNSLMRLLGRTASIHDDDPPWLALGDCQISLTYTGKESPRFLLKAVFVVATVCFLRSALISAPRSSHARGRIRIEQ